MGGKSTRSAEVFLSPARIDEMYLRGKNVVVIDVLRASTTISAALNNGAKEIIPVASIEAAVKISSSLFGDVTLRGGERNGKIINGFNLGNSPLEYAPEIVRGKSIIYSTTNGTIALTKARYASRLAVGSFVNFSRVADFLKELKEDFIILCAGKDNDVSLEDTVCAGILLSKIRKTMRGLRLDDAGTVAITLAAAHEKDIRGMLDVASHGKFLAELGFQNDLGVCAAMDTIPVLPMMAGNVIRLSIKGGDSIPKAGGIS